MIINMLTMRRSKLVEGSLGSSLWVLHGTLGSSSHLHCEHCHHRHDHHITIFINVHLFLLKGTLLNNLKSNWLFDDIFVVALNTKLVTCICLFFSGLIYFWQLRMSQTFSWVSIQVNGAADIDYRKILSRWPSTFTGSHFNIQIHQYQYNTTMQWIWLFLKSGDSWWSFIPPCGFCWLPRGVVYTMCTPHIYHLYLACTYGHQKNTYTYTVQKYTNMCSRKTNSCTLLIHFLCSSLLWIRADAAPLLETDRRTKMAVLTKAYTLTQANTLKTTKMLTMATLWVQAVKYSWQHGLMQRARSQKSGPSNFKWIHIFCQNYHIVLWPRGHFTIRGMHASCPLPSRRMQH